MNSNSNRGNKHKEQQMNTVTKATFAAVLITLGLALGARAAEPPKVGVTPREQAPITHDWPAGQTPHPLDMPHRRTENQKPYQL